MFEFIIVVVLSLIIVSLSISGFYFLLIQTTITRYEGWGKQFINRRAIINKLRREEENINDRKNL